MKWILVLVGVITVWSGKKELSKNGLYYGNLKEECLNTILDFRRDTAIGEVQTRIRDVGKFKMKQIEGSAKFIKDSESQLKKLKMQQALKFGPVANMKKISWDDNLAKSAAESIKKCPPEGGRASGDHREAVVDISPGPNFGYRLGIIIHKAFFVLFLEMMTVSPADIPEAVPGEFYWADREKIGCAVEACGTQTMLLCHLSPGNSVKGDPFIVGEPCSKCPDGYSCEDKLCAKKEKVVEKIVETVKDSGSVESSSNKAERYGFGVISIFIVSVVSMIL